VHGTHVDNRPEWGRDTVLRPLACNHDINSLTHGIYPGNKLASLNPSEDSLLEIGVIHQRTNVRLGDTATSVSLLVCLGHGRKLLLGERGDVQTKPLELRCSLVKSILVGNLEIEALDEIGHHGTLGNRRNLYAPSKTERRTTKETLPTVDMTLQQLGELARIGINILSHLFHRILQLLQLRDVLKTHSSEDGGSIPMMHQEVGHHGVKLVLTPDVDNLSPNNVSTINGTSLSMNTLGQLAVDIAIYILNDDKCVRTIVSYLLDNPSNKARDRTD